ncbi:tyrosine-type recombinase/integrase [Caulobacter sp. 1776]|uniref:tyrosine-type recombinase/integrase n=1 Tax=Caulobacter sp. 1776 TaxID=3156420 RepID=UPI003394870D
METVPAQVLSVAVNQDDMVIRMWLHGRQPNTVAAYEADVRRFLAACGKSLSEVTLLDLQTWGGGPEDLARATRVRRLAAVKSLLSFATKLGYLVLNAGAALRTEKPQSTAAARILREEQVALLIRVENTPRLRALLRLLYVCGLRASEAAALRWRDLTGSERKGGEARILGKGSKLRAVRVPADLWRELAALTTSAHPDAPVIPGRDGGPIDRAAVHRAVKRAARRAALGAKVSPHWLRHAHASHALKNGCAPHVLRESMGHASLATTTGYLHLDEGEGSSSFIKG